MVKNRWINKAISQTENAIRLAKKGFHIGTDRTNCVVCRFVKNVHNVRPHNPYSNECMNPFTGKMCPARDMCLEYCKTIKRQTCKTKLIKRLFVHIKNLENLQEI